MPAKSTNIILILIFTMLVYVMTQYLGLYEGETESYFDTILKQARICGRNIDTKIFEFEDELAYSVFEFEEDHILNYSTEKTSRLITTHFRRFYSQNQDMIKGIYFADSLQSYLFSKSRENYFNLQVSIPPVEFEPGITEPRFIEAGTDEYFIQPYVNKSGIHLYDVIVLMDIPTLVKGEFGRFYIGNNSYNYLINSKGEIIQLISTIDDGASASLEIHSRELIASKISAGLEGKIEHQISQDGELNSVLSVYYPLSILDNKYGIVFSINESYLLSEIRVSFIKITFSFVLIITLVVILFLDIIGKKKKVYAQLVESEEKQSGILSAMPDSLLVQDEAGIFVDVYVKDEKLLKRLTKQFIGKSVEETFIDKSLQEEYKSIYERCKKENKLSIGELKIHDHHFFEVRISPINERETITFVRDISKEKLAELNLKSSHERFITVLNSIQALIYVADMNTYEVLFINDYTRDIHGDIEGKKCYKTLQCNQNVPCDFCTNDKLIDQSDNPTSEYIWEFQHTKTGEWYKVYDKAIKWLDGRIVRFEIAFNITETKKTLEKMKESEEKFRAIYESFLDVYFRTDLGGTILIVSPSCKKIIGYSAEELTGKKSIMLYADPNERNKFVSKLLKDEVVNDFEMPFLTKSGEIITVSLNSRLIFNDKRQPVAIEGSLRDVTERNKTMLELQRAKIAAEAADKTKSQFLASMSHELRTPLNGILGYTQIFLQDETLEKRHREGIEIIQKSGEHLLNLINDILDISKIEADRIELEMTTFNLKETIATITRLLIVKAREKEIELKINFNKPIPDWVIQDEKRLKQVLINLLNNAIKFTDKGKVLLDIAFREKFLKFSVIDTGIGIPVNKFEDIFSPFSQLKTHINKTDGTGLGLSICRKLVKLMGGDLVVKSEVGIGSEFYFEIPVEIESNPASIISEQQIFSKLQGYDKKILIVDDNDLNRLVLKKMIQKGGLIAIEAIDGLDAYQKVREYAPDLVLMDKFMPNMDGIEAAKKIKSEFKIPIVLVSATKYDENELEDARFDAIVLKPVKRDQIFELMNKFLNTPIKHEKKLKNPITVYPEAYDLDLLLEFINKRNISRFYQYLELLEKKDNTYIEFANEMKKLAGGFEIKKIKNLLEEKKELVNEK